MGTLFLVFAVIALQTPMLAMTAIMLLIAILVRRVRFRKLPTRQS
jgi:hypothetical protein